MHDVRYDAVHDEFLVTNPFAQALLIFRGGASGEEAPIRIIQGPRTRLQNPERLDVDPVNDEIFVPTGANSILVFPRTGEGDVAPIRVIRGPDTQLRGVYSVAVDAVHDLVVAGTQYRSEDVEEGFLLIYPRTANGNAKPLRVIQGPKTGIIRITQLRVYPPKGWIVAAQAGNHDDMEPDNAFIGVWSVNDDGDVPPRWTIGGPKSTLKKPRGVVLDPKNKELIVADMRLNAVLTYYFPEIF